MGRLILRLLLGYIKISLVNLSLAFSTRYYLDYLYELSVYDYFDVFVGCVADYAGAGAAARSGRGQVPRRGCCG